MDFYCNKIMFCFYINISAVAGYMQFKINYGYAMSRNCWRHYEYSGDPNRDTMHILRVILVNKPVCDQGLERGHVP